MNTVVTAGAGSDTPQIRWQQAAIVVGMVLLTLAVTWPNLRSNAIDDLDSAHHLMDGYFFRDLLYDHPHHGLATYALAYYKQYPALGFLFWPPLIPAVYGLFCLVGGVHVLAVRACMFCFGLAFCLAFYALLRRNASTALSVAGVTVVATAPGMVWSFNQIMLEMPTLAFMFLSMLVYFNFVEKLGSSGTYKRAVLCGLVCGSLIYSKQPAWFLLCAFVVDYLLRVPRTRWHRAALLAAAVTIVVDLPLAAFTVVFGRANLGQSLGQSTNRIMQQYHSLPRASFAAWTFYPSLALSRLDLVIVVATVAALLLAVTQRTFLRNNLVWIAWFMLAYLTFSYYDNRSPRHATFWWPAWIALAVSAASIAQQSMPRTWRWAAPALLLIPVPFHLKSAWKTTYSDYVDAQQPVDQLFAKGEPGTILLLGADKQVFTAVIREYDTQRATHIIRGERLLESGRSIAQLCHDFRANTVLIEGDDRQPTIGGLKIQSLDLHEILRSGFVRRGQRVPVIGYRYLGPMSPVAENVSLSNALTQ